MQLASAFSRPQTVPPVPTSVPKKNLWILSSWRDLVLYVGTPLLLLTSGAHRVDTAKVAAAIGVPALKRATPDFVRTHTGQVIGGVSPFAHPAPVRTYLDPWLRRYDVVWAAAGHPAAVFSSTFAELQQMTGADELDMA